MAFGFIAAAHYDSPAGSSSSAVVDKPTGTVDDDIMFCVIHHSTEAPNSDPSGWNLLVTNTSAADGYVRRVYWKVAASEGSSYTWGFANAGRLGASIVTYRDGFDTADPIDVSSNTAYITNDANLRAAAMTVTAADSPLIFFGFAQQASLKSSTPPTGPTTFTEDLDLDDVGDTGSRFYRCVSSVVWGSSGSTGTMDATLSVSLQSKHAFAVALNPASAGGSIVPQAMAQYINQVIQ